MERWIKKCAVCDTVFDASCPNYDDDEHEKEREAMAVQLGCEPHEVGSPFKLMRRIVKPKP